MTKDPTFKTTNWFNLNTYDPIPYSSAPPLPGCYAICLYNIDTRKNTIMYIGTAQNLKIRLKKHAVYRTLRALHFPLEFPIIKIKVFDFNRKTVERKLIERLNPPINYV